MDQQFDVLAKTLALAGEMPRREAVRRVGGAFAAVALTSTELVDPKHRWFGTHRPPVNIGLVRNKPHRRLGNS